MMNFRFSQSTILWGAQAASLQSSAACRRHRAFEGLFGKLPKSTGWQPVLPDPLNSRTGVNVALTCHPERSEGSHTSCATHTSIPRVINHPVRAPSPSTRLGMTAH